MGTMREILFRGKRLSNGEWVEGFLVKDTEFYGKPESHTYIINHKHPSGCYGQDIFLEVDPTTVGQYTGLTANDKRIFEGDIVNGLFLFERPIAGVVTFRDGSFGVQWMRGRVEEFSAFTSCCNVAWEVIGNIADNPELLEGGVDDG